MKDINASISLGHFCGDVCLYYWKFCLLNETMFPDMVLLSVLRSRALSRCYHEGPKSSLSDCKNFLNQFEGGSVDLIKSGSVAHLVLNHPERRNAMSGAGMSVFYRDILRKQFLAFPGPVNNCTSLL